MPLTRDMRRVLQALCAEGPSPDGTLPLRRIARRVLGDSEKAARVLAALDLEGYVRTDTMGWLSGRVTRKGRQQQGSSS